MASDSCVGQCSSGRYSQQELAINCPVWSDQMGRVVAIGQVIKGEVVSSILYTWLQEHERHLDEELYPAVRETHPLRRAVSWMWNCERLMHKNNS